MNANLRRAQAKKQKFLNMKKKHEKQQEESLSDVDEMEVSENMLGKLFHFKYITLKYLGSGTFSRVWLVYNLMDDQYYAMKMYYPKYQEDGQYEVRHLLQLGNTKNIVQMYDHFTYKEPNENNNENDKYSNNVSVCLIVELMGKSLMKIYDIYDKGVPYDVFKQLTFRSLISLNELHSRGLIHTDIKMENLMLDQLTGDVKELIEWFKNLQPQKAYKSTMDQLAPENWGALSASKRKHVKKEIKRKAAKKLSNQLYSIINNYVNEMNKFKVDLNETKKESSNNNIEIDLDNEEMPELVNLEDVKKHEETQMDKHKNTEYINDDELDMDLIKTNVKIADMGNACSIDKIDDDDIQIRSYRAPEVVMGEIYNEKVDIWSMACLFYELLTHQYLFEVDTEHDDNVEQDRLLLAQMYSTLGKMPYEYCIDSERTYDLFDEKGRIKNYKKIDYQPLEDRIATKRPDLSSTQQKYASELIRNMLQYEIAKRPSAASCLEMNIFNVDVIDPLPELDILADDI